MQINLGSTLFGALITAFITAVGWIIRRYILDNPNRQQLFRERLDKIYTPLMNLMEKGAINFPAFFEEFERVVTENRAIIPSPLMELFDGVARLNGYSHTFKVSMYDIEDTTHHIETNYHWLRKKMGYDYEKKKICKKYLIAYKKVRSRLDLLNWLLTYLMCLMLPMFGMYFLSEKIEVVYATPLAFLSFGIAVGWLSSHMLCKILSSWDVI